MVMREDSDDNVPKTALSASALPQLPTISPPPSHLSPSTSSSPLHPTALPTSAPSLPIANFSPLDRRHNSHLSFYPIYKASHTITPYDFGLVDFSSAAVELHLLDQGFYVVGRRAGFGVRLNGQSLFSRFFLRRPVRLWDGDVLSFACARFSSSTWFDAKVTFDRIELDRRESLVLTRCLPSRIQAAPFHTRTTLPGDGEPPRPRSCRPDRVRNSIQVASNAGYSGPEDANVVKASSVHSSTPPATSDRQHDGSALPSSAAVQPPSSITAGPVAISLPPSTSLHPGVEVSTTLVLTSGLGSKLPLPPSTSPHPCADVPTTSVLTSGLESKLPPSGLTMLPVENIQVPITGYHSIEDASACRRAAGTGGVTGLGGAANTRVDGMRWADTANQDGDAESVTIGRSSSSIGLDSSTIVPSIQTVACDESSIDAGDRTRDGHCTIALSSAFVALQRMGSAWMAAWRDVQRARRISSIDTALYRLRSTFDDLCVGSTTSLPNAHSPPTHLEQPSLPGSSTLAPQAPTPFPNLHHGHQILSSAPSHSCNQAKQPASATSHPLVLLAPFIHSSFVLLCIPLLSALPRPLPFFSACQSLLPSAFFHF